MRAPNPRTAHAQALAQIRARTAAVHAKVDAMRAQLDDQRARIDQAMARVPGPTLYLPNRRWTHAVGTPMADTLSHTPVEANHVVVVLSDGRTLGLNTTAKGLLVRKGMIWPRRADAFVPQLQRIVGTWTHHQLTWDTLEDLPHANSAHVRLARRGQHTGTTQVVRATQFRGAARIVHPLWCADVAWSLGEKVSVRLWPGTPTTEALNSTGRIELGWDGDDLGTVRDAFHKAHPSLDRFERGLGWMFFGRWCGWPLSGKANTPIFVGAVPAGGNA